LTSKDWISFEEWQRIQGKKVQSIGSPFNNEIITVRSVYLWNEMTAPLPSGSTTGEWGFFPCPQALSGFLRYVLLPAFFGVWLVREEWDAQPEKFIKAEELFEFAERSKKCRYLEDIPLMKELIADLDCLVNKDDREVCQGIVAVSKKFNNRWENASTWCFKIQVFETPVSVGAEIFDRFAEGLEAEDAEEEFGISKSDWLEICRNAIQNTAAQDRFMDKVNESGWF
jgi:hypothetical protein